MRTISRSTKFKKDFKREARVGHPAAVFETFELLLDLLAADLPLPDRYRDHALLGDWINHRDFHVRPDLVVIYQKVGKDLLELVRFGSHSELDL